MNFSGRGRMVSRFQAQFPTSMKGKAARFWALLSLCVIGLVGVNLWTLSSRPVLELCLRVRAPIILKDAVVYFDTGRAVWPMAMQESIGPQAPVEVSSDGSITQSLIFVLPTNPVKKVEFDPPRTPLEIDSIVIQTRESHRLVQRLDLARVTPFSPFTSLELQGGMLRVLGQSATASSKILLPFDTAPEARHTSHELIIHLLRVNGLYVLVLISLFAVYSILSRKARAITTFFAQLANSFKTSGRREPTVAWRWVRRRPKTAIALTATLATMLSAYPIAFCGKSYVSPDNGNVLLYHAFPTLPGYHSEHVENMKGTDLAAMFLGALPYAHVEHRALFKENQPPLWNRDNYCGVTLIGQGLSMLGDPLHLLVIFSDSAAWAWDVKYLLAKSLFCLAIGLTVLRCTNSVTTSMLLATSSAFIGFFAFRFNHAAFFSFCYAPWIIYCWVRLVGARSLKEVGFAAVGLVVADWIEVTSGTVKEAYMLLLCLNVWGLCVLLFQPMSRREKLRKAVVAVIFSFLFLVASAPFWVSFLHELSQAFTVYENPPVGQVSPQLLIGTFDEMFFREIIPGEGLFLSSANFFILLGSLFFLVGVAPKRQRALGFATLASALLSFALVYGVVPASTISAIPFLKNIGHIFNVFSCVLIIHFLVLAGLGIKGWLATDNSAARWVRYGAAVLLLAALLVNYNRYLDTMGLKKSPFFYGYALCLCLAFLLWPLASRLISRRGLVGLTALAVCISCFVLLHWRHAAHLRTPFDDYVQNPQDRVNLSAQSPAIEWIKTKMDPPARVAGFSMNLFAGWSGIYDLEGIFGADALINRHMRELFEASGLKMEWNWRFDFEKTNVGDKIGLFSMLNTKYFVDLPQSVGDAPQSLQKRITADLAVYENTLVWPRAFFTNRVCPYGTLNELMGVLRADDLRPFAAVASDTYRSSPQIQRLLSCDSSANSTVVPATGYHLTNNSTSFMVDAPGPGVIVLTEAYLPADFELSVNGLPATYFRVNHAFKGIVVDQPGTYRIIFNYWPKYLTPSLLACALGWTLTIVLLVILIRSGGQNFRTKEA
jgi:hypothetical protein